MGLSNGDSGGSSSSKSLNSMSSSNFNSIDNPVEIVEPMSKKRRYITVGVLFLVNLLNYMDRYTIAG